MKWNEKKFCEDVHRAMSGIVDTRKITLSCKAERDTVKEGPDGKWVSIPKKEQKFQWEISTTIFRVRFYPDARLHNREWDKLVTAEVSLKIYGVWTDVVPALDQIKYHQTPHEMADYLVSYLWFFPLRS